MTDEATEELLQFYDYVWSDTPGFVYLPVEHDGKWTSFMFQWPRQRLAIARHTLKWSAIQANVFYSPAVYSIASPKKEGVKGSWVLWVDFDGNAPIDWAEHPDIPRPTLRICSSIRGHEHVYWRLEEFLDDVPLLEERNRSLAYALHADTSGWDADQILRPPRTTNHKRNKPVVVEEWDL